VGGVFGELLLEKIWGGVLGFFKALHDGEGLACFEDVLWRSQVWGKSN
jgi:hypothetical protein